MSRKEVPLVLGTAGHIDHGKTTLVRALTGVDCDRLEEEKRRGITIELGFAPLELPGGVTISIVDVPGHEKFIRQMVAGAAGIDAVLFVVAADEGVMPQTREHLEILELLGITKGIVALTKTDRVDKELLDLAAEDVSGLLRGTFLETAPIVPVSAQDGSGIPELLEEIVKLAGSLSPRTSGGPLFLPIDRVFPVSGFGTVVTGTAYSGKVSVGEEVEILPSGAKARVRSLEIHDENVTEALAGQRTALNLTSVNFKEVHRGDVLCTPSLFKPSSCLDIELKILESAREPVKHWQRVRLHIGTSDLVARVSLFDPGGKVEPGGGDVVQLVLEEALVASFGQGFVIRAYSPLETIGGGQVLFPYGWKPRNSKRKADYSGMLQRLRGSGGKADRLEAILDLFEIMPSEEVLLTCQLREQELEVILNERKNSFTKLQAGRTWLVSKTKLENEWESFRKALSGFHAREPHLAGMTIEDSSSSIFRGFDPRVAKSAISLFCERGLVVSKEARVALNGFAPEDKSRFDREIELISGLCEKRGFELPTIDDALSASGLSAKEFSLLLKQLRENGKVHVIGGDLLLSEGILSRGIEILKKCESDITLAAFRDLSGTSRKYALPFLEYLDTLGVTRRVGEKRVLRPHWR